MRAALARSVPRGSEKTRFLPSPLLTLLDETNKEREGGSCRSRRRLAVSRGFLQRALQMGGLGGVRDRCKFLAPDVAAPVRYKFLFISAINSSR